MPSANANTHTDGSSPGSEPGRYQGWSDPRSPCTTAKLLIARHAGAAEDHAAAEMAGAQAVGDAGSYMDWAEVHDAIVVLQEGRTRVSGA